MVKYDPKDDPTLWPDEGYAVIEEDEMKHPSSDDWMVNIGEFENAEDVVFLAKKPMYKYHVHSADKERWTREHWEEYVSD